MKKYMINDKVFLPLGLAGKCRLGVPPLTILDYDTGDITC